MNNQKTLILLIGALVIVAGAYFLLGRGNETIAPTYTTNSGYNSENPDLNTNSAPTPAVSVTPTQSPASKLPAKNSLIISPQVAGSSVVIDYVYLEQPGFIVIHANQNGKAGAVIGYSGWLSAGPAQDISFKAALKSGTSYLAKLHGDNGDKKFSASADKSLSLYDAKTNEYISSGLVPFTVD